MNTAQTTDETLALVKQAMGQPGTYGGRPLEKGVSIGTGLTAYDLAAPAKNLYPVITPLRNSLPRVRRTNPGDQAHWKSIFSIAGSGYDSMGWVPEGQRSASMSYTSVPKSAVYVTLGEEDYSTLEAESAGEGFEDINAMVSFRLLQKTMRKEETALLHGNASVALGTVGTVTTATAATGGTIPDQVNSCICVALTGEGFKNSSVTGGVATSMQITGNDGYTYTLNGGSSNKSAAASQTTAGGNLSTLSLSVAAIPGAVAYAWYVGLAGAETLQAITTINSVLLTALTLTGQNASAITADHSKNATLAYDGLLTNALNTANSTIVTVLATGTAGTGTKLTSNSAGGVTEIDAYLQTQWETNRLTPTVIYVNSQQMKTINSLVAANGSAPLLRYNMDAKAGGGFAIVAGGRVTAYHNPYTVDPGGSDIPILIHPDIPAGTILFHTERLPVWYQQSEVGNVAEVLLRRDYYRIDWPMTTRRRYRGVYMEAVLAVYYPQALGAITNIAP